MYFPGHTNIHGPYDRSPLIDPGRNTIEGTFPSSFSNMYRSGKHTWTGGYRQIDKNVFFKTRKRLEHERVERSSSLESGIPTARSTFYIFSISIYIANII